MSFKRKGWVLYLLLFTVVLSLYSVSLGHNFLFDEESIILNNPFVKDLSLIPQLLRSSYFYVEGRTEDLWVLRYRPLASLFFAVDYYFWKGNPLGYNLTNTLLQALVCLFFLKLLTRVFANPWTAFAGALLYSVHTLHTEAVTNIASRGDLLAGLGMLLAMHSYWENRIGRSVLFYVLALFSKENAILTPAYLFFLDLAFLRSDKKTLIKRLLPFAGAAILYMVYRKFFCPVPMGPASLDHQQALLRFLSMGPAFLDYLQALVMPEPFKLYLLVGFVKDFSDPKVFVTLVIATALLIGWFLTMKRRGTVFFGMSLFLTSLLPSLQIVHYYPEWAEHYLYIPAMGLVIMLGSLLDRVWRIKSKLWLGALIGIFGLYTLFLSYRTWQRNDAYNGKERFFLAFARSDSPYKFFAYQNLGYLAVEKGDLGQAKVYLDVALAADPGQPSTYHALSLYFLKKKDLPKALLYLERALQLDPDNGQYRIKIGELMSRMGRFGEAIRIFEEAQAKNPKYYPIYGQLMNAFELNQEPVKAIECAERGLAQAKNNPLESAKLIMEKARLFYREGEDKAARTSLAVLLRDYPAVPWYSDVARFLAGEEDFGPFLIKVRAKYPGFETSALRYGLMALVLNGRAQDAREFYEQHKRQFDNEFDGQPLFKRELARVGIHEG